MMSAEMAERLALDERLLKAGWVRDEMAGDYNLADMEMNKEIACYCLDCANRKCRKAVVDGVKVVSSSGTCKVFNEEAPHNIIVTCKKFQPRVWKTKKRHSSNFI